MRPPLVAICVIACHLSAATTGRIAGTIKDQSGSVIPNAAVSVTNLAQGTKTKTVADTKGAYAFPSLPIGRYNLDVEASGFRPATRQNLILDIDSALEIDITLNVAERIEAVTVSENQTRVAVETSNTQMGEVVSSTQMTSAALNGRSYTDLLALQPGIVPTTTQTADSIVMAGVTTAIAPSGVLNAGNQSISGQREDANGYVVNGGDVKELMNGGTLVVPNLDSIAEFRVLTNNFDAQYGNYSGGIVNVVTKSGGNELHGSGFEFLRNTALDARNFFSPDRSFFRQNQFGGTLGGPIRKNHLFYFADYQGTRLAQGIDTGLIPVPSFAERTGNFSDAASSLTGSVSGPFLAKILSQKLGHEIFPNEPYYQPGCDAVSHCVFPNAIIPQTAWSDPSWHLLQYIPSPNSGPSSFSTASEGKDLRDDKGSVRIDAVTQLYGQISAYYYFDDYTLNNPYPREQGGASVPGFNALNLGRGQLFTVSATKSFSPTTVNELRLSAMRNSNNLGRPQGGVGPSLASQGFTGIVPLDRKIEGVENVVFNAFTMGVPITNLQQANNTYSVADTFSKVQGPHTIKAGFQFSAEQINVNPNATFNGSFLFTGSETGNDFADFLIGVASNFNQADSQTYYPRHKYAAAFAQDSWRIKSNLTINYGVRWDLMRYWSEKYNQDPTFIAGEQSIVYPTAPRSLVYVGDPGVPSTLVPQGNRFAPRLGLAWSPQNKTSIRAGYGLFYSVVQGNIAGIDEPQPPYGLSYTSPAEPLFATPFTSASDGTTHVNPFPLSFPPLNASASHPNANIDFSGFLPLAGMDAPPRSNTSPYAENYFLSIEREITAGSVLSVSYVGSQAHHLLVVDSANPGNPALCLALSDPRSVAPGSPTCGPFGEDTTYTTAAGRIIQGTRVGLGPNFSNDSYIASIGNSSYNALEASFRHYSHDLSVMISYTYSKSIDQSSSLADPINPYNYRLTRALSAWDLTHNLVATYQYELPFAHLTHRLNRFIDGWTLSGITRANSGFPVTLHAGGDNSLLGSIPNGVNNHSLDLPDYNRAPLQLNGNPRNGRPYFNVDAFSGNALGTPGTASRRSFHGPGALNFDLALLKSLRLDESRALQFRLEAFNAFNHAQFFGPTAVDGEVTSALFGQIVNAASPRLVQVAIKLTF